MQSVKIFYSDISPQSYNISRNISYVFNKNQKYKSTEDVSHGIHTGIWKNDIYNINLRIPPPLLMFLKLSFDLPSFQQSMRHPMCQDSLL